MQVRCTIENNDQSGIRPNQTYQSLVNAAGGHNELGFIEKDVRNYITRETQNVSEEEDANELGKYFYQMKKMQMRLYLTAITELRMRSGPMQGAGLLLNILEMLSRLTQLTTKTGMTFLLLLSLV
ncbi:hypothetical protein PIB30_061224 [Stylosanthes scabra]|uniref:Uncharacterized protein n=1 Tax=Stylosanthes scabra TaxID=79078 RepID=A0ABU6SMK9_9FABA|nr:hypothetical protein [Stylosanthes scabra]